MASEPAAPDWYSHGLNRVAYYRLATAAATALLRPVRLRLARGLGRRLARALPAERRAVRSNLGRVLAVAPPPVIDARVRETFASFGAFSGLATVVAALERVIRAYPTQWFNFFDAWSPPDGHA